MKKTIGIFLILFFIITSGINADDSADRLSGDMPTGDEEVSFVELGSVKCIPCKQMQPVMDAIEKDYAGKVKIVFHDVWQPEGRPYAEHYGIRLIPTQVFLNKDGDEIFRHEGFFPKEEIEKVLSDAGVTK
ncbi:MAG: thioredoxin family protein [Candidatus Omnitrophota bacterium]